MIGLEALCAVTWLEPDPEARFVHVIAHEYAAHGVTVNAVAPGYMDTALTRDYLAAHPDDENTALIAYWANGALYEGAYLSVTRGDGGQNLLGGPQRFSHGLKRSPPSGFARPLPRRRRDDPVIGVAPTKRVFAANDKPG